MAACVTATQRGQQQLDLSLGAVRQGEAELRGIMFQLEKASAAVAESRWGWGSRGGRGSGMLPWLRAGGGGGARGEGGLGCCRPTSSDEQVVGVGCSSPMFRSQAIEFRLNSMQV
jgi:hypothetical protein